MALFTSKEDQLIEAMTNRRPQIQFPNTIVSVKTLIKNALKKEPRLLAFLEGYETNYVTNGLTKDYNLVLKYHMNAPNDLADVVLDTGSWDPETILAKGGPREMVIVTDDVNAIATKLNGMMDALLANYEGILGWHTESSSFPDVSSKYLVQVSYQYQLEQHLLRQKQGRAAFAAKSIWRTILGRARVAQFAKPFLALSYIAQECIYDQRAYDELETDPHGTPSDPIPHLAYGPLVEKRGICSGLAWAFKRLMDEANVECICVTGYLKEDTSLGHMWNMVKLDGQYYHVDPTWGIKGDGVFIGGLMQTDNVMKVTHIWDEARYPKARGVRFDYDFVEEYLADNGTEFLDDGASEKYFYPDKIVE